MVEPLAQLTPGRYLSTPGLWLRLLLAAAFLLIAIALVASWLPARRAARINPIQALRAE